MSKTIEYKRNVEQSQSLALSEQSPVVGEANSISKCRIARKEAATASLAV